MRSNVAHAVLISLHRIYIPHINEELHNELAKALPELALIKPDTQAPSKIIDEAFKKIPDLTLNVKPQSPNETPNKVANQSKDAKTELLEKIKKLNNNS
jgi:hypothetical protein